MKNAEWSPVPVTKGELNTKYEMTSDGRVRNAKTQRVLKPGRADVSPFVILLGADKERYPFTVKKLVGLLNVPAPAKRSKPISPEKLAQIRGIREALGQSVPVKQIADNFEVSQDTVRSIKSGKTYADVQ